MINYIVKDIKFIRKYFLFVILYCVILPAALIIDGDNKFEFASFLIPFFSVSILLGKISNLEDGADQRVFLKLLPQSSKVKVGARYTFMAIILLISQVYLTIIQVWVFKVGELMSVIKINTMTFVLFMAYFSVYIMLFYLKDYYIAQNSIWFFIIVACILAFANNKMNLEIDIVKTCSNDLSIYFMGIIIIVLMFFLSCKFENRKV